MEPKLTRERWAFLAMLFLINVVTIAAHSIYLVSIPVWVYVLNCCLLAAAIVFVGLERRKLTKKNSVERT